MSKLFVEDTLDIAANSVSETARTLFMAAGAPADVAGKVADHLVEADQCGIASHGVVRILQYTREMLNGTLTAEARPEIQQHGTRLTVQAHGGIGIPAMRVAHERAVDQAVENGISAVAVLGAGHTGRLGAFGEMAARQGCLTITMGGGNRKRWRMVAPFGGRDALLPTNPYCIAIPGGDRGPVVIDIATSQAAGGWIYAARAAGVDLPEGIIIDRNGNPSSDPEDYFNGGAILPKGGPLGYGLALIAELVGEAMLGPVHKGEINWFVLAIDCRQYNEAPAMQAAAEEILSEIRVSAPASRSDAVLIPGEREREALSKSRGRPIKVPRRIWDAIQDLKRNLSDTH